jgi:hypothetical protein
MRIGRGSVRIVSNGGVVVKPLALAIAEGTFTGYGSVNKFGSVPTASDGVKTVVWDLGNTSPVYPFPDTAKITHIKEVVDVVADRNLLVNVQGLDASFDLVVQSVSLNAANSTTLSPLTTPLKRVFRMKVDDDVVAGASIQTMNASGTIPYSLMQPGNNQTLMAIYTVPRGKTAYIISYYCDYVRDAVKDPDSIEFQLWVADRKNNYEFQLKHQKGIPKLSGGFQHSFDPYQKVTEQSDIMITGSPDNADAHLHAGFDIILVDN